MYPRAPALRPWASSSPIHSFDFSVTLSRKRRHAATMAMASATMATAAGFDKRASSASSLQTPGSGSFPSELVSPLAGSPGFLKRDDLKTPITPPSAYLDFLRNMTPAMMSPASTGTSSRFNFGEKPYDKTPPTPSDKPLISPPTTSQPKLSRNPSHDSSTSNVTTASERSSASNPASGPASAGPGPAKTRPESPRVIIPPSPFAKPAPRSARTPRRLHIPQSPYSQQPLGSAHSVPSPYSSTPLSAAPWSASFSPREVEPEANGKPGKVSVRQVVTRTVTYCRTPLEPAPKGKRRKIEAEEVISPRESSSSKESSVEPPIKQEKKDEDATPSTATAELPKES